MKKLLIFWIFITILSKSYANSYEIFELKLGLKANNLPFTESVVVPAAQNSSPSNQIDITVNNSLNQDGKLLWIVDNRSNQDLKSLKIVSYIDIEIDQAQHTFFNETATVSALNLPTTPTQISHYIPSAPIAWQIDEPGYQSGNLNQQYRQLSLNNRNALSANTGDIAVAFQHTVPYLEQGGRVYIEARIGDRSTNGIQQFDTSSQRNYHLNSTLYTSRQANLSNAPTSVSSLTAMGLFALVMLLFLVAKQKLSVLRITSAVLLIVIGGYSLPYANAQTKTSCVKPIANDMKRCLVNFQLRSKPGKTQITWEPAIEKHAIFRSDNATGPYSLLHNIKQGESTFLDADTKGNKNYFYQIKSLDQQGKVNCITDIQSSFVSQLISSADFNRPPKFTSQPIKQVNENTVWEYTPKIVDPDKDSTSIQWVKLPKTAQQSHGKISWKANTNESATFAVLATDARGAQTLQQFLLKINNSSQQGNNVAPEISGKPITQGVEKTAYSYQVIASDCNKKDVLTFSLNGSVPNGMHINASSGLISWASPLPGAYPITVTVTDQQGLSDSKTFTLTILSKLPPVAKDDEYRAISGEVLTVNASKGLMQNDSDPNGESIKIDKLLSQPSHGVVKVNTDGSFSYTPNVGGIRLFTDIDLAKHSATLITSSSEKSAGNMVNGFENTPWIAAYNDANPTITAEFKHPVAVKQLELQMPKNTSISAEAEVTFYDAKGQELLQIPGQSLPSANTWLTIDISNFTNNQSTLESVSKVKLTLTKLNNTRTVGIEELKIIGDGRATNFVATEKWRYQDGSSGHYVQPLVADLQNDGVSEIYAWDKNQNITLLSGKDGTVVATGPKATSYNDYHYDANAAIADINNDGLLEIATVRDGNIVLLSHELKELWSSANTNTKPPQFAVKLGLSIADLNQDGKPEIIANARSGGVCALDSLGKLLWCTKGSTAYGTVVADINLDGKPEIITTKEAYAWDGTLLKSFGTSGYNPNIAIANTDDDAYAEIIIVTDSRITIIDHDYSQKTSWAVKDISRFGIGAPTVADFNNDGKPEIGVATRNSYQVWTVDGTLLWLNKTIDASSGVTGSTVFDFEGDGSAEVVYRDEKFLYVYRGTDGTVLFQTPVASHTLFEYPLVADIDDDGQAEIIVSQDLPTTLPDGTVTAPGIIAYESPIGNWISTRKIWNQYSYHVTNINEDGTVPRIEENNWLTPKLNNYRQNTWGSQDKGQFDSFSYQIINQAGKTAEAKVYINVNPANTAPVFTSTPVKTAVMNQDYLYAPTVSDVDGDTVSFKLVQSPAGMSINSNTGLIKWTPTADGKFTISILVTDEHGFSSPQSYEITVSK